MELILGDITKLNVDAIVTAAHSDLKPAPGLSAAVFRAADTAQLTAACRRIGRCRIGHAVVTPSCGLPCKYIIHAAGPGWYSGHRSEHMLFAQCYLHALNRASAYHCRTVALPLMFSGACHLPRAQALEIVFPLVTHFEQAHPGMKIQLVLYSEGIYRLAEKMYRQMSV